MAAKATLFGGLLSFTGEELDMRLHAFILQVVGVWGPDAEGYKEVGRGQVGCARMILFHSATLSLLFLYVAPIISQCAALFYYSDDLIITANNLCLLLETIAGFLKAAWILRCRKGLHQCLHRLHVLLRHQVVQRRGSAARGVVAVAGRSSYAFSVAYLAVGLVSCSCWFAYPLLIGTQLSCWEQRRMAENSNVSGLSVNSSVSSLVNADSIQCPMPILPAVGWFPFDVTKNPGYMVAYIFQVLSVLNLYLSTSGIDNLLGSLMIYFSSQLEILALDISSIRKSVKMKDLSLNSENSAKTLPIKNMEKENDFKYEKYLSNAIDYHQKILDCSKDIQSLVTVPSLVQFAASMVIICTSLYALAETSGEDFAATAKFGAYSATMLFEIGIYCWFGNDVIEKSENIVTAAYGCFWYEGSLEFKRRILFMMLRTQRTLSFRGGIFYELSRSTFLSLVNASYSFYNLLRSTQ